MQLLLSIFALVVFLIPFHQSTAQIGTYFQGAIPRIEILPAFPAPHSTARASINDYSVDTAGAMITWRINGAPAPQLQNQRTIDVPVGELGVPVLIEAALTLPNGNPTWAEATIIPTYLDLIVEPQTRTPHFYQGRALPSVGSTVNVTALLNAGAVSRNDLIYTWRINNNTLLGGPRRGQNQVSIIMPQGGALLQVEVQRVGGETIAETSIELLNNVPEVRFYEVHNLYGMQYRPVSTLTILGNSSTVRAEPFHLDSRTFNNPDVLEWRLAGTVAPASGSNPYEVTLVRQFNSSALPVSFHVRSLSQILQGAQGTFSVQ